MLDNMKHTLETSDSTGAQWIQLLEVLNTPVGDESTKKTCRDLLHFCGAKAGVGVTCRQLDNDLDKHGLLRVSDNPTPWKRRKVDPTNRMTAGEREQMSYEGLNQDNDDGNNQDNGDGGWGAGGKNKGSSTDNGDRGWGTGGKKQGSSTGKDDGGWSDYKGHGNSGNWSNSTGGGGGGSKYRGGGGGGGGSGTSGGGGYGSGKGGYGSGYKGKYTACGGGGAGGGAGGGGGGGGQDHWTRAAPTQQQAGHQGDCHQRNDHQGNDHQHDWGQTANSGDDHHSTAHQGSTHDGLQANDPWECYDGVRNPVAQVNPSPQPPTGPRPQPPTGPKPPTGQKPQPPKGPRPSPPGPPPLPPPTGPPPNAGVPPMTVVRGIPCDPPMTAAVEVPEDDQMLNVRGLVQELALEAVTQAVQQQYLPRRAMTRPDTRSMLMPRPYTMQSDIDSDSDSLYYDDIPIIDQRPSQLREVVRRGMARAQLGRVEHQIMPRARSGRGGDCIVRRRDGTLCAMRMGG